MVRSHGLVAVCVSLLLLLFPVSGMLQRRVSGLLPRIWGAAMRRHGSAVAKDILGADGSGDSGSASSFFSKKDYASIGASPKMEKVLKTLHITNPSKIQAITYSSVLSGKHCVIGDQTGSGKTIAYLAPILQRMDERLASKELTRNNPRTPYVIVLTPTTELATQVARVTKSIANSLLFRTSCFTSKSDFHEEHRKIRLGVEVLVATPARLMDLLERDMVSLKSLQTIVLDEVDTLYMDKSHPLEYIGTTCPSTTQFVFTSATIPSEMLDKIRKEFTDVSILTGPGLHRVSSKITERIVDCSPPYQRSSRVGVKKPFVLEEVLENKMRALDHALQEHACPRTLIFCNTIEQCRTVENHLSRHFAKTMDVYTYHSAIEEETRMNNLRDFSRKLNKGRSVMLCTDRASRGMDFDRAEVDHVILFDFPRDPSEYLRRIGRTGRAGRTGTATVLVYGPQVQAARTIVETSQFGQRMEPLPSSAVLWAENGLERKDKKALPSGRKEAPGLSANKKAELSSGKASSAQPSQETALSTERKEVERKRSRLLLDSRELFDDDEDEEGFGEEDEDEDEDEDDFDLDGEEGEHDDDEDIDLEVDELSDEDIERLVENMGKVPAAELRSTPRKDGSSSSRSLPAGLTRRERRLLEHEERQKSAPATFRSAKEAKRLESANLGQKIPDEEEIPESKKRHEARPWKQMESSRGARKEPLRLEGSKTIRNEDSHRESPPPSPRRARDVGESREAAPRPDAREKGTRAGGRVRFQPPLRPRRSSSEE